MSELKRRRICESPGQASVQQTPASALTAPSLPVVDPARRTVIMGAGLAGLTAAYELMRCHLPSVTLEQAPRFVGGASRTEEHRGYRFAIGSHLDPWQVNTDAEYHEEARFSDEGTLGRHMPTLAHVEK